MGVKVLVTLITPLLINSSCAQTATSCEAAAIHFEARGESVRGQRAILDVIRNRMRIDNRTACQVIRARGQFPWSEKYSFKSEKYSSKGLTQFNKIDNMESVLREDVYYFNTKKQNYGRYCCKIGKHYFNYLQ